MLDIQITVTGSESAAKHLLTLSGRARDPQSVFRRIEEQIAEAQRSRLDSGRGIPKDKPVTLKKKRRDGIDTRPLHGRTGLLVSSLTKSSGQGAIREIHADSLLYGTSVPYARFQGKRKPLWLTPKQREPLGKQILDYLLHA